MKKTILTFGFSLLLSMGLISSSNAVSLEGLSVGVSGSHAGFYAVGTEKQDNKPAGVEGDTKEAGAFTTNFASVFVEYNFGPISLGVDYIPMQIETPKNTNIQVTSDTDQTNLTNTVMAEFENHTTVYAILPVPLGGLYLKAGWVYVDINSVETLQTGGSYGNTDTTGLTAGIGYSHEATDGVTVRAEVLAAEYDSVSMANSSNTTTSVSVEDMMGASARISLVKTF